MGSQDNPELTPAEYREYCIMDAREKSRLFDKPGELTLCRQLIREFNKRGDV